jgi:uncharacterized protein YecE (DUF72 family)
MTIRVGVGGWTFAPWRGTFFPKKLPQKQELHYASRQLTAIEVNGTYYRTQTPDTFAHWHDETPDDFVFTLKGPRYTTNRRVLAEAGPSVGRFLDSGIARLRGKLGPINWQFLPTKTYDPEDFEAFLALLPRDLRHVVEVRHPSFDTPAFLDLARRHGVGVVMTDNPEYPRFTDSTAPFVYTRLQCAAEAEPLGYSEDDLDTWAKWVTGRPEKDVFLFFINGFKPHAPAAATALLDRLR